MNDVVIQLIGVIAYAILAFSYFKKEKKFFVKNGGAIKGQNDHYIDCPQPPAKQLPSFLDQLNWR